MLRFIAGIVGIGCVLVGCEGEHREYVPPQALQPGAAGTAGLGGVTGASAGDRASSGVALPSGDAQVLGVACQVNADCLSGFCVDGVCCRSSCDTVCSRCDEPGSEGECTVSANDEACALSCPASTDCRGYGSGALTANCEALGLCRTLTDCQATNAPLGAVCARGVGTCDGQGECVVAGKKRLGETCTADADCGEGNCVIGSGGAAICCDAECAGLCQTCGADGHCDDIPRDDARCGSVDCPDSNLCRDYVDDISVNLCRGFAQCKTSADCTFAELRPGAQCSCGAAGCVLSMGTACEDARECATGACEATVAGGKLCCAQSCGASGQSCTADGSRCVQCDSDGAECQGNDSRVCSKGVLAVQTCGNGCDVSTGLCTAARPTGSVCDSPEQCQSSVCSLDVTGTLRCCDATCAGSGRACGADGSCVCPAGSEAVDGECLGSIGQACAQNEECASNACVSKVGGGNVCCAQSCAAGSFCSADGSRCVQCEGAASSCQGTTASRCEDGALVNTQCGNGCNTSTGVCNGLLPNTQPCTAGGQCASNTCSPDLNGTQRCCTPNCAASGRVCGVDGSCVCRNSTDLFVNGACRHIEGQACAADGDCRSGACESTQGAGQVCCSGACNGQICRANGQGCVACEGNGASCQGNSSRACVNNAFVTTSCANGCNPSTGLCNNLLPRGSTGCSSSAQCAGTGVSCQGGRCCEFNCAATGKTCDGAGLCQCPGNTVAVGNACLLSNGSACDPARPGDCASGRCNRWFPDSDGDLHGDSSRPTSRCGNAGEAPPVGFVVSGDDCCDSNADVFPGQTTFFAVPQTTCAARPGSDAFTASFDYDCDGRLTGFGQYTIDRGITTCDQIPIADCRAAGTVIIWHDDPGDPDRDGIPRCGATGVLEACAASVQNTAVNVCSSITADTITNSCR